MEKLISFIVSHSTSNEESVFKEYIDELKVRLTFVNNPLHSIQNIQCSCYLNALIQLLYVIPFTYTLNILTSLKNHSQPLYKMLLVLQLLKNTPNTLIHGNLKLSDGSTFSSVVSDECANRGFQDISDFLFQYFLDAYPSTFCNIKLTVRYTTLSDDKSYVIGTPQITKILLLDIHPTTNKTLADVLFSYTKTKPNDNKIKWNNTTNFSIQETITLQGPLLFINLKRYIFKNNQSTFIEKPIDIPLFFSVLNINGNGFTVFELISFSIYIPNETTSDGHYVTVSKPLNNLNTRPGWYLFDDTKIKVLDDVNELKDFIKQGYLFTFVKNDNKDHSDDDVSYITSMEYDGLTTSVSPTPSNEKINDNPKINKPIQNAPSTQPNDNDNDDSFELFLLNKYLKGHTSTFMSNTNIGLIVFDFLDAFLSDAVSFENLLEEYKRKVGLIYLNNIIDSVVFLFPNRLAELNDIPSVLSIENLQFDFQFLLNERYEAIKPPLKKNQLGLLTYFSEKNIVLVCFQQNRQNINTESFETPDFITLYEYPLIIENIKQQPKNKPAKTKANTKKPEISVEEEIITNFIKVYCDNQYEEIFKYMQFRLKKDIGLIELPLNVNHFLKAIQTYEDDHGPIYLSNQCETIYFISPSEYNHTDVPLIFNIGYNSSFYLRKIFIHLLDECVVLTSSLKMYTSRLPSEERNISQSFFKDNIKDAAIFVYSKGLYTDKYDVKLKFNFYDGNNIPIHPNFLSTFQTPRPSFHHESIEDINLIDKTLKTIEKYNTSYINTHIDTLKPTTETFISTYKCFNYFLKNVTIRQLRNIVAILLYPINETPYAFYTSMIREQLFGLLGIECENIPDIDIIPEPPLPNIVAQELITTTLVDSLQKLDLIENPELNVEDVINSISLFDVPSFYF
jgi:hypothetical protein